MKNIILENSQTAFYKNLGRIVGSSTLLSQRSRSIAFIPARLERLTGRMVPLCFISIKKKKKILTVTCQMTTITGEVKHSRTD